MKLISVVQRVNYGAIRNVPDLEEDLTLITQTRGEFMPPAALRIALQSRNGVWDQMRADCWGWEIRS